MNKLVVIKEDQILCAAKHGQFWRNTATEQIAKWTSTRTFLTIEGAIRAARLMGGKPSYMKLS